MASLVLICIFLMTNDIEYIFMGSLASFISSLSKYTFTTFAHFLD